MLRKYIYIVLPALVVSAQVKIGRIAGPGDDVRLTTEEFWSYNANVVLEPLTHRVPWWNALDVAVGVCKLAQQGVQAFVLDGPPRLRSLLGAYSEHMEVPSVGGVVSVVPDTTAAAAHLLQQWKSFAFIYQTDQGANQLQRVLRAMGHTPQIEAFWRTNGADEALEFIRNLPQVPLLLACSKTLVDELLNRLPTLRRSFDIMLLTPVGGVSKRMHPGSYRLVQFSYLDSDSPGWKGFENRWNTIRGNLKQDQDISDSAVLNHEASKVLQNYFTNEKPAFSEWSLRNVDCFNFTAGLSAQSLKEVVVKNSLTGDIKFDEEGNREGGILNIYEERPYDLKKIGSWSKEKGVEMLQNFQPVSPVSAAYQQDPPLRVTSVIVRPFLFEGKSGNLEGYVIDLLEELMSVMQMRYVIQLSKDGSYGMKRGDSWTGMVGELTRNEADLAVAPLTKNRLRETAIDFSKNFMTVGLNILLKKPDAIQHEKSSLSPFSFLTVWSAEMWAVIVVCVIVIGAACYLISRYIGPPDRVRALESKGTDNLSPCGSFWFTLAAMVQRDTGIYPRTFSHRVWACIWWALCFFLAVGYVSYLTAALIETRNSIITTHTRKTSHEVIQDLLEKGSPDIGVVKGGSTMHFFLNSEIGAYKKFGRYLESNPEMMLKSYDDAVKKVRESNGSYAFVMESPSSQYHANRQPCDTFVTSGYLTTISFAVGLSKNSPYKQLVDHAVLVLMENGILRRLYEKWWHNYTSEFSCEDPSMDIIPKVYSKSLKLQEVSGAFYILILMAVISIVAAVLEKKFKTTKQMVLD